MRALRDDDGSMPLIGDGPWPQLATDQMSCMITLATQAEGHMFFFEKMFESRLYFVDRHIGMAAHAPVCDLHRVVVSGKSTVQNANMIERGYECVEEKLLALGAWITRKA